MLPDSQMQTLRHLAAQVRHRMTVYETWGFAAKGRRGLGVSALFSGESGNGKTLPAEVLAHELALDLYRIDLSAVVSKYIGETEKNLKQVFDAAEEGGSLLLFDEADALFAKRTDGNDSNSRFANIEVGYLLQRMEAYQGLAILTTNRKSSIDTAFQRRLRFTIDFRFPDAAQREAIWKVAFPAGAPVQGSLDPAKLAQLKVAPAAAPETWRSTPHSSRPRRGLPLGWVICLKPPASKRRRWRLSDFRDGAARVECKMSRIHLTIDRIVLRGFDPNDRRALLEGLQTELSRLLADPAIRATWASSNRTPVLKLGSMPISPGPAGGGSFGTRSWGGYRKGIETVSFAALSPEKARQRRHRKPKRVRLLYASRRIPRRPRRSDVRRDETPVEGGVDEAKVVPFRDGNKAARAICGTTCSDQAGDQ